MPGNGSGADGLRAGAECVWKGFVEGTLKVLEAFHVRKGFDVGCSEGNFGPHGVVWYVVKGLAWEVCL